MFFAIFVPVLAVQLVPRHPAAFVDERCHLDSKVLEFVPGDQRRSLGVNPPCRGVGVRTLHVEHPHENLGPRRFRGRVILISIFGKTAFCRWPASADSTTTTTVCYYSNTTCRPSGPHLQRRRRRRLRKGQRIHHLVRRPPSVRPCHCIGDPCLQVKRCHVLVRETVVKRPPHHVADGRTGHVPALMFVFPKIVFPKMSLLFRRVCVAGRVSQLVATEGTHARQLIFRKNVFNLLQLGANVGTSRWLRFVGTSRRLRFVVGTSRSLRLGGGHCVFGHCGIGYNWFPQHDRLCHRLPADRRCHRLCHRLYHHRLRELQLELLLRQLELELLLHIFLSTTNQLPIPSARTSFHFGERLLQIALQVARDHLRAGFRNHVRGQSRRRNLAVPFAGVALTQRNIEIELHFELDVRAQLRPITVHYSASRQHGPRDRVGDLFKRQPTIGQIVRRVPPTGLSIRVGPRPTRDVFGANLLRARHRLLPRGRGALGFFLDVVQHVGSCVDDNRSHNCSCRSG
mmetsp:Transcript_4844/g.11926  ORF Transcript_4844/g.11926 Transcript_4844/m.11926 type:complete len:513 (-) Transcript_4844:124-1662(-)